MSITETISQKLTTIAQNSPKVYAAGVEKGRQEEYDAFWDAFQDNGNRTRYDYAFRWWKSSEIKPKYPIISSVYASDMFEECRELLYAPVVIAEEGYFQTGYAMFTNCQKLLSIDWDISIKGSVSGSLNNTFLNCYKLVTIKSLTLDVASSTSSGAPLNFSGNFMGMCHALENVEFRGTIRNDGLNMRWSTKLSRASIESLINTLSAETSGLTVTLSLDAVKSAFETAEGAGDGNVSADWLALAATKSNWTISLA